MNGSGNLLAFLKACRERITVLERQNTMLLEACKAARQYLGKEDWAEGDRIEAVARLSAIFLAAIEGMEGT